MTFMTSTYHTFAVRYLYTRRLLSLFSISNGFCPLNEIFKNCNMRYHNRTFRMHLNILADLQSNFEFIMGLFCIKI